jgi:hypothetical protein
MSLVQIWLEKDRARVAVDTVGHFMGAGAGSGDASKIVALSHAGIVLAYRGCDIAFFQVFAQIFLTPGNDGYDAITKLLPIRVQHASTQFRPDAPDALSTCELFVVGYSAEQQRMAGTLFNVNVRTGSVTEFAMNGSCRLAPGFNETPALDSDAAMIEMGRRQVAWMRVNAPEQATGGRLMVAEVERGSISIRDAGLLDAVRS